MVCKRLLDRSTGLNFQETDTEMDTIEDTLIRYENGYEKRDRRRETCHLIIG